MAEADVIVGLDDSVSAAAALSWAAHYARLTTARLLAVHVSPFLRDLPADWAPEDPAYDSRTDEELGPVAVRTRAAFAAVQPEPGWGLHVVGGPPGRVLVDIAKAKGTRLLALGARKHTGIGRLLAGSVSHYCLSHSLVPVAAVPAPGSEVGAPRLGEIVLGLDDSPSGLEALSWAAAHARATGRRVRAIHVLGWPMGFVPKQYEASPERYLNPDHVDRGYRVSITRLFERVSPEPGWVLEFAEGHPGKVLAQQSRATAGLVIGTQEQVGLGRLLLGSVSHYALNHAACPVVAVPAKHDPYHPSSQGISA